MLSLLAAFLGITTFVLIGAGAGWWSCLPAATGLVLVLVENHRLQEVQRFWENERRQSNGKVLGLNPRGEEED